MLVDYNKLQNGSDIRGVAIEGAGKKVNLTPNVTKFIAYGFKNFRSIIEDGCN